MTRKRRREVTPDEEKSATIKELTGPNRKNKLLNQNPDLEKAQEMSAVEFPAESKSRDERKKKRKLEREDSKQRVQVVEQPNVVEVVYEEVVAPPEVGDVVDSSTTDLDWLRARTSRTLDLESDSENSDNEANPPSEGQNLSSGNESEPEGKNEVSVPASTTQPPESPSHNLSAAESKILKTGRLFVRNLVYGVTEEDLRDVFSPHGPIEEVMFPLSLLVSQRNDDQTK